MPETTSNLAQSHCSRGTGSRWCIFHRASWEASDSSWRNQRGRLQVMLGFETALGKVLHALRGMSLPAAGTVPNLWCCKGWVAGDGQQHRGTWLCWPVSRFGGQPAWWAGMFQRGLGKVLSPFSFPGVDAKPKTWYNPLNGACGLQEKD